MDEFKEMIKDGTLNERVFKAFYKDRMESPYEPIIPSWYGGEVYVNSFYYLITQMIESRDFSEERQSSFPSLYHWCGKKSEYHVKLRLENTRLGKVLMSPIEFIIRWPPQKLTQEVKESHVSLHMEMDAAAAKCLELYFESSSESIAKEMQEDLLRLCVTRSRPKCLSILLRLYRFDWDQSLQESCALMAFEFSPWKSLDPFRKSRMNEALALTWIFAYVPTYMLLFFVENPLPDPNFILDPAEHQTLLHYAVCQWIVLSRQPLFFYDVLYILIVGMKVNKEIRNAQGKTALDLFKSKEGYVYMGNPEVGNTIEMCLALLENSVYHNPERNLAVAMALHSRLGRDSDLRIAPPEAFEMFCRMPEAHAPNDHEARARVRRSIKAPTQRSSSWRR